MACVAIIIAESSQTESSKRFCAFSAIVIAEPIQAWCKNLLLFIVELLAPVLVGCKKHLSSLSSFAFIVSVAIAWIWVIVAIAWTWVIVAGVVAVVADKAWGLVTSFKLEWWSMSAWIPVGAVVVGMNVCLKCAGLPCGSCKKLKVAIVGLLFRTRIVLLDVFGLLWDACTPKKNALQLVEWKDMIHTRNTMSAKNVLWFVFAKDLPFVIVTRWYLKVMGLINCENHCGDHCLSVWEGYHQCPKDADNQVF